MSRPSPRARRRGRFRPGHARIAPSEAVLEVLRGDFPEPVKQRCYLLARGALSGRRTCLVCGGTGWASRIHVPPEALRLDQPRYDGIKCYWLCAKCAQLPEGDAQIAEALEPKRSATP
jgi:hypothetical protein